MKKRLLVLLLLLVSVIGYSRVAEASDKLKVSSSFTIITNMLEEIGGDYVEVYNIVPTGTDPHEYEPLPEDIKKVTDSAYIFYSGLNLEGGEKGWISRLAQATGKDKDHLIEVSRKIEPMYLQDEAGVEEVNPHAFLDPENGILMAEAIIESLSEIDPDNEEAYLEQGEAYIAQLQEVANNYKDEFSQIPSEERIFICSEHAFQYVTENYDVKHGYIWEVDTDDTGTPEQIKAAVAFVNEYKPKTLFLESNVDPRPMQTVSKETGVAIYPVSIYADEIGAKGEETDTYLKLLEHNLYTILAGLK